MQVVEATIVLLIIVKIGENRSTFLSGFMVRGGKQSSAQNQAWRYITTGGAMIGTECATGNSMETQTNVKSLSRIDLESLVMLQCKRIAELEQAIQILRNGAVLRAAKENINDLRRLLRLPELAMGDD